MCRASALLDTHLHTRMHMAGKLHHKLSCMCHDSRKAASHTLMPMAARQESRSTHSHAHRRTAGKLHLTPSCICQNSRKAVSVHAEQAGVYYKGRRVGNMQQVQ